MSDFERAFAFLDLQDERAAERLVPTRFGPVLVDTRMPLVHDLNFLRVERPARATAEELAAEAERVQGAAPGVRHRRVNIRDEAAAARLEGEFVTLGWQPQRFVLMAWRREADRPPGVDVVEVDEPAVRSLWAEGIRNEPHGKDETLVQQILRHRQVIGEVIPTRYFAVEVDGRLVAHAELYSEGGVGQVEDVVTLPAYRGRGFARATVLRAVTHSRREGNELTFLVADADDWPQRLYERLGFETVGRYARFLKARQGAT